MSTVSFKTNISPLFQQYQAQMRWRFDLTDYDDVKANADLIYSYISPSVEDGVTYPPQMPPPPFSPFTDDQIAMFKTWMDTGFAP